MKKGNRGEMGKRRGEKVRSGGKEEEGRFGVEGRRRKGG